MSIEALTPEAVAEALRSLPGWAHVDGGLQKTYAFGSFREAMSFLLRVAFSADAADHHPTLTNTYNRVTVALSTHDVGNQTTAKDTALAAEIESFSWA